MKISKRKKKENEEIEKIGNKNKNYLNEDNLIENIGGKNSNDNSLDLKYH